MDRLTSARIFLTIAERGSLAAAAATLDMSRAMVTRYLAEMEQWAGARLFHRTTRRLSLTVAGEVTLARCRELLAVAEAMPMAGEEGGGAPRGLLRLAASQFMAQSGLAAAVSDFLAGHPQVSVDLLVDNRAVNLIEQRIDLAIRVTNTLEPGLIARRLGACRSIVCAAPAYLARHGAPASPEELAAHNCLTYSYFGKSMWQFSRPASSPVQVAVGGALSSDDSMALLAAAVQGAGISMQPRVAALPLVKSGRLVQLLPEWEPPALGLHGIYASRQHMPLALRAMLDHLVQWFASAPAWLENA